MADETEETTDDVTAPEAAPASAEAPSDDVVAEERAPEVAPETPETPEVAPEAADSAPVAAAPAAAPAAAAPAPALAKPATPTADDEGRPNRRKVREGVVVSDAMQATVVVAVVERVRHPRYGKTVQRTKKLYVHDAEDTAKVGDRVRVQETRPLSKLKRWRLTEVVERAR
jgi:small subunit ribosomal protein S17